MLGISEILQFLVLFSLGFPLFVFGLYGIILLYYGKQSRAGHRSESESGKNIEFEPTVSVVIPTHNEGAVISKRIENLLNSSYPKDKFEMIFVDDSSDNTPDIIREYSRRFSNIRLIRFDKRMGYSPSLIAGCKAAESEIVVFAEAGSFLDEQAIAYLVTNFRNPNIGVVTGNDVILNVNEEVGKSEDLYQKVYNFVRTAESNMDSTIYMKGEAAAVRKHLIEDLKELERVPGTADTAIGLLVRKRGYRFVYDPRVKFYEYAPSTRRGRIRQKVIRGANLIKVLWEFRSMFFRREYGLFGMITLPFSFAMLALVPLSLLVGIFSLILLTPINPAFSYLMWILIGSLFLLALLYSKHFVLTFLEFEYSLLKALYETFFVRKTHDKIDKVASTRR